MESIAQPVLVKRLNPSRRIPNSSRQNGNRWAIKVNTNETEHYVAIISCNPSLMPFCCLGYLNLHYHPNSELTPNSFLFGNHSFSYLGVVHHFYIYFYSRKERRPKIWIPFPLFKYHRMLFNTRYLPRVLDKRHASLPPLG